MINIVLQEQIRTGSFGDDVQRLLAGIEEIAGHIIEIDRLDQQRNAVRRQQGGCVAQIVQIGAARQFRCQSGRQFACHTVQAGYAECQRIVERLLHAVAEFRHALRIASHAALARIPVTRRQVEQHQLQLMVVQALGQFVRRIRIREQQLDAVETGRPRQRKALQERHLVKQHRQIGSELRHGS
jgi:hypothetical protein